MIRIITDTASDITAEESEKLGISLVPLVTSFEDGPFPMNTKADFDRFYEKLRACKQLPVTSRPSPQSYLDLYEQAKEAGDEVLVLSLSSGLSGTLESAHVAKQMSGYDRITIIDTQQAVMSQRILVEHAVKMKNAGESLRSIVHDIMDLRERVTVVGVIGSMVYLRKGGRIPPALGVIGDALQIKPVITLKGVIETIGKARGLKAGYAMAWKHMEEDGVDPSFPVIFGYTSSIEQCQSFMESTVERFPVQETSIAQVGGIIGTHLGENSIGAAYVKKAK